MTKSVSTTTFAQQVADAPDAATRLALYRAAARTVKPAQPKSTWTERVARVGAGFMNFGTNVKAVYTIEREVGRM